MQGRSLGLGLVPSVAGVRRASRGAPTSWIAGVRVTRLRRRAARPLTKLLSMPTRSALLVVSLVFTFTLCACGDGVDRGACKNGIPSCVVGARFKESNCTCERIPDGGLASPEEIARSEAFWSAFRIDGEWAEYQPTLGALAESADLVATGTITGMMEPITTQGDAIEDVVTEATLALQIERSTSAEFSPTTTVTLTVLSAQPLTKAERTRLSALLPSHRVLVMLRKRSDNGLFRLVNGYGLWTSTARLFLDCPIEASPENCSRLVREAGGASSFAELASKFGL